MQFVDSLFAFPRPRQAAHFLWTFAIIMSLRLLFHGCAPIPGALEIHPGLAMIPVAGIQFGAARGPSLHWDQGRSPGSIGADCGCNPWIQHSADSGSSPLIQPDIDRGCRSADPVSGSVFTVGRC